MANSIRLQYQICLSHSRTPPPQIQLANLQELFPVPVPVLVMGLASNQGQVPCPTRERSPHKCLVVSDLKPAPRPIPRSRNWFQIRHHQVNLARTSVADFRTSWPRMWPGAAMRGYLPDKSSESTSDKANSALSPSSRPPCAG